MKLNENVALVGKNVILVPYKEHHVLKYHDWMKSEELQKLTASEPLSVEDEYAMQNSWHIDNDKLTFIVLSREVYTRAGNEIDSMVGDVNIFLNDFDDRTSAEIEIMIANPGDRCQGYGREALTMMLAYAVDALKMTKITAKIGSENTASKQLFTKLKFDWLSSNDVFREDTFQLNEFDWLIDAANHVKHVEYDELLNKIE